MTPAPLNARMHNPLGAGRVLAVLCTWIPRQLGSDFPLVSEAFADSAWTSPWSAAAAYVPLFALAVGLSTPFLTSAISNGYAASLPFVLFAVAGAILTGTVGVVVLIGYAAGALATTAMRMDAWSAAQVLQQCSRLLVSVVAFSVPTLFIPRVAHGFVPPIPDRLNNRPEYKNLLRAGLYAASCALLVFVWCRGLPTMLRPVASLATGAEARDVSPITWSWPVVVAVAAAAAFARVVLEERVMAGPHGPMIAKLKRKRWSGHRRVGILHHVPKFVRRSASVLLLLFIFGGTFSSWTDILITAVLVAFVLIARMRLVSRMPVGWTERITKIPILVRFTAALVVGYALSAALISLMWSEATMQSVTVSTLLSLTLFALCFPEAAQSGRAKPAEYTAVAASASFGCALIAFLFGSAVAAHAQGFYHGSGFPHHRYHFDDPSCSGLADCYESAGSAATTSSSTAALGAIVAPGIVGTGSSASPTLTVQAAAAGPAWTEHVADAVQQSNPTSEEGVREQGGSGQQAWSTFSRFAQAACIHPHPNLELRDAGGYIAQMADKSVIGYRPFTRTGPPTIDLHGVAGFKWLKKFRIVG